VLLFQLIRLKLLIVSHDYMLKVYKFFGFGDRIIRWLSSIGTNRNAAVRLADDKLSLAFDLGRGHAQGDSPSSVLYNLAAQIFIFKLELNPLLKRLRTEPIIIPDNHVYAPLYKHEGLKLIQPQSCN
jgi:hypothetical protein